jgi:Uma2 family endonuclease
MRAQPCWDELVVHGARLGFPLGHARPRGWRAQTGEGSDGVSTAGLAANLLARVSSSNMPTARSESMTARSAGEAMLNDVPLPIFRRAEHTMVMPAAANKRWSADEARALNEANPQHWPRYEVIDGELLVSPAPRSLHQDAVLSLARRLSDYTDRSRIGHTMIGPADIELERDSTVSPDVFVTKLVNGRKPRNWKEVEGLWLVAEVLSPSTARSDRVVKRAYFGRNQVPEYWVVDLDARLIERWRPDDDRPELEMETLGWTPTVETEPLTIDLPALFAEVYGE